MGNQVNKLDEFIRQKANEASFELREQHWQKAMQLLDENDEGRKKPFWLWGAGLVILLSIGGFIVGKAGLFGTTHKKGISNKETQINNNISTNSFTNTNQDADVVQRNSTTPQNTVDQTTTTTFPNQKASATNAYQAPSEKPVVKQNTEISLAENTNPQKKTSSNNSVTKKLADNTVKSTKNFAKAYSNSVKQNENKLSKNESDAKASKQLQLTVVEEQTPPTDASDQIASSDMNRIATPQALLKDFSAYNPRYVKNLDYNEAKRDLPALTQEEVLEKNDAPAQVQATNKTSNNDWDYYANQNNQKRLAVVAGVNASQSMKANNTVTADDMNSGWKPSPYIGLAYYYPISNNISFSAWLAFSTQRGLNAHYSSIKTRYGFGRDTSFFKLKFNALYQLHIPLMLQYKVNNNHFVAAGLNVNYTLANRSAYKDYGVNFYQNSFSYNGAFNDFDLMAMLSYQYRLNPKMDLFLNYNFGLNDISKNEFFNNQQKDRSQKIQVGVTYKLN